MMIRGGLAAFLVSVSVLGCSSSKAGGGGPGNDGGGDGAIVDSGGSGESAAEAGAAYPPGPYGINVGQVFPDVTWTGAHGAGATGSTGSADYYDPDGSKGIRGVYFDVTVASAGADAGGGTCPPCNQQAAAEESAYAGPPYDFSTRGGRIVDVLAQSWQGNGVDKPTTAADIAPWVAENGITYDVVIDPAPATDAGSLMTSIGGFPAVPSIILVDPRTMKVTARAGGVDPTQLQEGSAFDALVVKNGAPSVDAGTD